MREARLLRASVVTGLWLACACAPPTSPPNVILISIDTLRADHLGVYGYPRPTSPVMDAFASDATVFEHAYSQAPKTAPSHMTLLTGLHPEVHGVKNWGGRDNVRLAAGIPTLASLLAENGYSTMALTDFGHVHPKLGFDRGFQSFQRGHGARRLFRAAEALIARFAERAPHAGARPFFLFLHTYEVHDPYTPPLRIQRLFTDPEYAGGIVSTPEGLRKIAQGLEGWRSQYDVFWSTVDRKSPEDLAHLVDLYDAGIRFTDRQLGRLFRALSEHDLLESTVVVLLSDHGEEFGEHGGFHHRSLYQEILHVPLVVRFPGEAGAPLRGQRISSVVRLVDLLPTLLDWIGIAVPPHVQGTSLLPRLRSQDAGAETPVPSHWPRQGLTALRMGPLKYITGPGVEELYDLATDAREQRNLLPGGSGRAELLRARLSAFQAEARELQRTLRGAERVELEAETRQQLEALGYLSELR